MVSKLKIICIGRIKEKWIKDGISEYQKRLLPFCAIEICELKDEGIKKESSKILEYKKDSGNFFVLSEEGKEFTSKEFSDFIKKESNACFFIGGPNGISNEVKKECRLISLSKMTFTHEMARLFLFEQIYRAFMIINNREYYNK
jgi:23S rRNA (pseudouridine1915-N3)-methyltransferase